MNSTSAVAASPAKLVTDNDKEGVSMFKIAIRGGQ